MAIKTDTATYPENPKVLQLPPAGGKYTDDLSDIQVLRFTDERDGMGHSFSTTYSVWNAFNRDATRIWLFEQQGPYYVGNLNPLTLERVGPLEQVVPARGSFVDYETMVWSSLDNDKGFILVDCQIWSYQPSTKQYTVVADLRPQFPSGARFNQLYVSADDNRFAAVVRAGSTGTGDYGIMVYEKSSNSIKLNISVNQINGITMGKDGRYVLLVREDAAGGQHNQQIYNVDTGAFEQLVSDSNGAPDYCIGHNDIGMDFCVGGDQWRGAFTARKMSTPHDVTMAWQYSKTGWINWHVSLRADNDSWALVSTYAGTLTSSGVQMEGPFVREIFQVGVKAPFLGQFRRLVHTRANYESPYYWYTPRATISRDGSLACWTGNNNGTPGMSRTDIFIAKFPPAPTDGTTTPPIEPPIEPPTTPTAPPVVTLTSPTAGATLSGKVSVTATITNAEGVGDVFLIADETVVGLDTTAPYEFQLDTTKMQDGAHSLWIRAWESGTAYDSARVTVTVKNAVVPPEPPKPCSISAPTSVTIQRNGTGAIPVTLQNVSQPTEVKVLGSDGQVTVSPLGWSAGPTSTVKQFQVRVKKQSRTITFSSGCGVAVVRVNVV